MYADKRKTGANSTNKKLAVHWLNEALCLVSSSVLADSFRLRNHQLLVAAKRYLLPYKLTMNLKDVILNCDLYEDSDQLMHMVFAKKLNDKFESYSEATVLQLTLDEMGMNLTDIRSSKCPGFDYFLEMNIIQDFYADIQDMKEYKSDDEKVKRIIYYAEFDA